jgi:putative endonuclease
MSINTGSLGEQKAIAFLREKNYTILAVNWRFRHLEIDIVAKDGENLVFIEVKTRSSTAFGEPESFVSLKKQKLLIKAANAYITEHNLMLEARFDVISIHIFNNNCIVKHLCDAFYPLLK